MLMFLVAMPVLVNVSNPSTHRDRRVWDHFGINGKGWSQRVNIEIPLSTYDITTITSNCLIILFSVLSVVAAWKRKKIIIYVLGCLIILTALVLMVYTGVMVGLYSENHSVLGSSLITHKVHNQLMDSLYSFGNSNPDIKTFLVNTMIDGCCCGVDGYRDFLEIEKEIPVCCKCRPPGPGSYTAPTCYGQVHDYCDNDPKYNVTSVGCFGHILEKIQHDRRGIHVTKMITFMSVSTLQLILVILAMIYTFRYAHAPANVNRDNSNSGVKFASLLEPANTKEDVSNGAA